jgi:hypothetical protein
MAEIYLPTLHWFAMSNLFTGSCGMLRFRAKPNVAMATAKEVDFEASTITVEFWHGLYCYEKSEMEGKQDFPMSDAGLVQMKQWLEQNI